MATREEALKQFADNSVTVAFQDVFGRAPTASELNTYNSAAMSGGPGAVIQSLLQTSAGQQAEQARIQTRIDEQQARDQEIRARAEAAAAQRVADRNAAIADTLQKTLDQAQAYGDTSTVNKLTQTIANLRGSTDGGQTGGGQTGMDRATAEGLVRNTFQTIFNRQPLQAGLDFWVNQLMSGVATADDLGVRVAQGAQGDDILLAQNWLQSMGLGTAGVPDRATAENLVRNAFQTVLNRQPLQGGLDYWVNRLLSGEVTADNLFTFVAEGATGTDIEAANRWRQGLLNQDQTTLTSTPLTITGETEIDPAIAPYLQEALGVARNLFLTGPGPQLYPGQMYVSPSQPTLDALAAAETLGRSTTATGLGADVLGAYKGGLSTLSNLASPDYMKSQEYKDYVSSVTRPVTEAVTEQILPAIASQYSAAGRYGSGAMAQATGRATELGTRALGDVTAQVANQQQGRMLEAQTALPSFLGALPSVVSGALAPSAALAGVGAQREAIAAQPLQEKIQRFEYAQNLPFNMLQGYLGSIYGSPLANYGAGQQLQGNTTLQDLGSLANIFGTVGRAASTDAGKQFTNWLGITNY
jgi:hypothetical protein